MKLKQQGEFKFLEDGFDLVDDPKPPKPPRDKKADGGLSYLKDVIWLSSLEHQKLAA